VGRDAERFVEPAVQVALIVKPGPKRGIRYGRPVRKQPFRFTHPALDDVLMRRQPHFLLEAANTPENAHLPVRKHTIGRGNRPAARHKAAYGFDTGRQSLRIFGKQQSPP